MSVAATAPRLDALFRARSLALVGAKQGSLWSDTAFENLDKVRLHRQGARGQPRRWHGARADGSHLLLCDRRAGRRGAADGAGRLYRRRAGRRRNRRHPQCRGAECRLRRAGRGWTQAPAAAARHRAGRGHAPAWAELHRLRQPGRPGTGLAERAAPADPQGQHRGGLAERSDGDLHRLLRAPAGHRPLAHRLYRQRGRHQRRAGGRLHGRAAGREDHRALPGNRARHGTAGEGRRQGQRGWQGPRRAEGRLQ